MNYQKFNRRPDYNNFHSVRSRKGNEEFEICKSLSAWLGNNYPDLIFHFDYAAGVKLHIYTAVKLKALNKRSYPDLFIAEARQGFNGLFIEVKTEKSNPFLKNGNLSRNKHVQEQNDMLFELKKRGYLAVFGVGLDGCKKIINSYLTL